MCVTVENEAAPQAMCSLGDKLHGRREGDGVLVRAVGDDLGSLNDEDGRNCAIPSLVGANSGASLDSERDAFHDNHLASDEIVVDVEQSCVLRQVPTQNELNVRMGDFRNLLSVRMAAGTCNLHMGAGLCSLLDMPSLVCTCRPMGCCSIAETSHARSPCCLDCEEVDHVDHDNQPQSDASLFADVEEDLRSGFGRIPEG
mmetsp:Transcript_22447/g.40514  ORF Transcript_22447/g.40514 Transcript_22447/m.40514 type:complete len:200 (+) Transcript_22447:2546-3145(+)